MLYHHRVRCETYPAAWETVRRLKEHGFDGVAIRHGQGSAEGKDIPVDFFSYAKDPPLDFLRPDILPPR